MKPLTMMPALAIMACPYCGAPEPHAEEHVEDQSGESMLVWCMSCGEGCLITRSEDEEGDEEC